MDFQGFSQIIVAIGTIVLGFFQYNQYSKNKKTDQKIREVDVKFNQKIKEDQESISRIYGYLWSTLIEVGADRAYIIQPHPPHDQHIISVTMEAVRKGSASVRPHIKNLEMSSVPSFVGDISKRQFIYYPQRKVCKDVTFRAIMDIAGSCSMAIIRLENYEAKWEGSLVIDWTHKVSSEDVKVDYLKGKLHDAANVIQHILPLYEG